MMQLIRELRRRSMFRAAGLYIGVWWIVLQVADVIFPVFNVPDWVVRAIIIVAVVGFPIVMVLAWLYELTEQGIKRDSEVRLKHLAPLVTGRTGDFIVIGILSIALTFSVYLNVRAPETIAAELPPLTLLVSNFENKTGDPLFDSTIEHAITIGLEAAPFISAYPRDAALRIAEQIQEGSTLGSENARLIAVREGIQSVLTGSIETDGDGFRLSASVVEPQQGETVAEASVIAASKLEVLNAVGELSTELRSDLGDAGKGDDSSVESFTAASLEAAHAYVQAQELARAGRDQEAAEKYKEATRHDPDFGRAYSGWALSEFKLGNTADAEEIWSKTLTMLDRMTEREKYRTLGVYYSLVSRDHAKAIENYERLVELYPADSAGHNNLAVDHFMLRDFDKALAAGAGVLDIYPKKLLYRANFALYAMYAGDFGTATVEAEKVIAEDPSYHKAYLPLAMAALVNHDFDAARAAYDRMTTASIRGASLAATGVADAALYRGDTTMAEATLAPAIAQDLDTQNQRGAAAKYVMLAESLATRGDKQAALDAIGRALEQRRREATIVPASALYIALGRPDEAQRLADELGGKLRQQSRAYGELIEARLALAAGETVDAVDLLRSGLDRADAWLLRFELGKAYLQAERYPEALSEFELCDARRGEVTSVFLNDVPTYRYSAELPYWLARAKEGLGMSADAREDYDAYLALRSAADGDLLAADAASRIGSD